MKKTTLAILFLFVFVSFAMAEPVDKIAEEVLAECISLSVTLDDKEIAKITCEELNKMTDKELNNLGTFVALIVHLKGEQSQLVERLIPERFIIK